MIKLQEHIENKKKEKLNQKNGSEETINDEDSQDNFTIATMTKDNFINLLNSMTYNDITLIKDRLSEIGIYNQFNDILLDKQNNIIEKLIEQKQELQRKILYQKEEIKKLRNSVDCYNKNMKYVRKKTLNDVCNRCGISFDKEGNPHRVTVFGKPILKEELIEKTKIQSNLLEVGLESKKEVKIEENVNPLEIMNEYFFTKTHYNPHIEDYNESYNRIKERQALIMLKSTTVNEKILLLNKQVRNAEITIRECISALVEEQRKSAQMKAKYDHALEVIRNLESQQEKYMKDYKYSYYINGVVPIAENKELIDSITKGINNDPYAKLVNKSATMTPNYLNNSNPSLNKMKRSISNTTTTKLKEMPNKIIPTIYVEEKTNSLNLELLEYKLENLKIINKLSLSDPPPPLTNVNYINYINNKNKNIEEWSTGTPDDVSNNKDNMVNEEVKKDKSNESIVIKNRGVEDLIQDNETPTQNEDNIESNNENSEASTDENKVIEEDGNNNNEEVNEIIDENNENSESSNEGNESPKSDENNENNDGSQEDNESNENIENNSSSHESNEMKETNEDNKTESKEEDIITNERNNENNNKSSKISPKEEENKSKNSSNETSTDEAFDTNQKISEKLNYLNEILNIKDDKSINNLKILSNSKYKKIDIKFSSDCENMFLPIQPSSLSREKLQPRIITPNPPTKYKMTYDKVYRDSDKTKVSSSKVKLPSLSSYEKNLKSKIIKNSKYKKNPYYQSKLVIDKF
ncbi:hypothetical protein LY90DRAFT_512754 [Neocallimastix californiae]|uniref:Uncharacterized protein n=1 Tax=Neocallimastix californiae TaxID=1754190 RepID=A0A1Y2B5G9_9FUNG|nr:hypothetical protein LY90DRAFT_512754 [Neocallimastix californiae]|eukprot:ORY30079.1 hypothetical protein LY90DRAFT_512754 [Neocallimastix californiae]